MTDTEMRAKFRMTVFELQQLATLCADMASKLNFAGMVDEDTMRAAMDVEQKSESLVWLVRNR